MGRATLQTAEIKGVEKAGGIRRLTIQRKGEGGRRTWVLKCAAVSASIHIMPCPVPIVERERGREVGCGRQLNGMGTKASSNQLEIYSFRGGGGWRIACGGHKDGERNGLPARTCVFLSSRRERSDALMRDVPIRAHEKRGGGYLKDTHKTHSSKPVYICGW